MDQRSGRRRLGVRLPLFSTVLAMATIWASARGGVASPDPSGAPPQDAPRLVVFVVIDQLRADLLTRYDDLFQGGLRRLLDEGFVFEQASHRHAATYTAPGHATLSTGVFPSRHGIVSNDWSEQTATGWRSFYNTFDSLAPILGYEGLDGRSPANLQREGLADWLIAAHPEGRVVSVSTKDRSAILMAGKSRGHVYWIDSDADGFVTSTHYRDEYPDWVTDLNESTVSGMYGDSLWTSTVPEAAEARTRPDTFPFEFDGEHTAFPHDARLEVEEITPYRFREWVRHTPRPDEATAGLALAALEELELGRRDAVDYLAVGLSQVDYVGHRYGPRSREQLDNLLRLDAVLGRFMEALDDRVGDGRWVMAFSADHGVVDIPEWRREEGRAGLRVGSEELRLFIGELNATLAQAGSPSDIQRNIRARALEAPFIDAVYTHSDLLAGERPDSFAVLFLNSYYPGRSHGLLGRLGLDVRLREGTVADGSARGTTHGSPYWYDRHVPLVFLGAGVEPGRSSEPVHTVDVAPTLAALAGIPVPEDLDGEGLFR